MKPNRRTRVDSPQQAIVEALRSAGWAVWIIGWPCDLLCWKSGKFRTLEVKPPKNKSGEPKLRKEQQEQAIFCDYTGTPYVTSPEQALIVLGEITKKEVGR